MTVGLPQLIGALLLVILSLALGKQLAIARLVKPSCLGLLVLAYPTSFPKADMVYLRGLAEGYYLEFIPAVVFTVRASYTPCLLTFHSSQRSPTPQLPSALSASSSGDLAFITCAQGPQGTARVDVYPSSSIYSDTTPYLSEVLVNGKTASSPFIQLDGMFWSTTTYGWNSLTLGNGVSSNNNGWAPCQFRILNNEVQLSGLAFYGHGFSNGQIIAVLSAGMIPTKTWVFPIVCHGGGANAGSPNIVAVTPAGYLVMVSCKGKGETVVRSRFIPLLSHTQPSALHMLTWLVFVILWNKLTMLSFL